MSGTKKTFISLLIICGVSAILALAATGGIGALFHVFSAKPAPEQAVEPKSSPAAVSGPEAGAQPGTSAPVRPAAAEGIFPADYTVPGLFFVNGRSLLTIYNEAPHRCMVDGSPTCRLEKLLDDSFIEYTRMLPGGWVIARWGGPAGKLIVRAGLTPSEKIDHLFVNGKTFFFSKQDGTLEQLTVISGTAPMKADVIRFDSSGAQTDCQCADGTVSCCGREEYNFAGKPNTYCKMFPSDPVLCSPAALAAETVQ